MKKSSVRFLVLTLLILLSVCFSGCANNGQQASSKAEPVDVYELYPTQNMWNFIKLDTSNGRIFQIQFAMEDSKRMSVPINLTPLVDGSKERRGRFALYPTQNIFTFILLDKVDGRTWQVQWSTEMGKRGIVEIAK